MLDLRHEPLAIGVGLGLGSGFAVGNIFRAQSLHDMEYNQRGLILLRHVDCDLKRERRAIGKVGRMKNAFG